MKLSRDQTARYAADGYLFFPGLLSANELVPLRRGLEKMNSRRGPEVVFEEERLDVPKIIFGADEHEEAYRRLRCHPSLLKPAEQLIGTQLYVYQFRVNFNTGFARGGWGWHQDYNQWYRQDGLRGTDSLLVGVFLDDVTACNAPLMVIPGSHRRGHIFIPDRMEIDDEVVAELVRDGGIDPLIGPAGSAAFCHPNTVHGSTRNITPWPRSICYIIYNSVENTTLLHPRGDHRCRTDFTPLSPSGERCLLDMVEEGTPDDEPR